MVFVPPSWVPKLPFDPPDSIPIGEFMSNEAYGRYPISKSRNPFTCGITGKTYSTTEAFQRRECIAKALSKIMGWTPNEGTPWEKVIGVFSFNNIDYLTVLHAIHRLSGIATPANVAYSTAELEHQLKTSGAKALFTCAAVLKDALKAAKASGIPEDKVFILDIPGFENPKGFKTVDDLVELGRGSPELEPLVWSQGQGARQVAFLCYSSGTSGLPKAVMISHRNVIANTMQYRLYESVARKKFGVETQVELGLLPFSHIYGLQVIAHGGTWRGDEVIVLPKFELTQHLQAIEKFKINNLIVVPPIVVRMLSSKEECKKYDLSSVRALYTGAAPTGKETVEEMLKWFPKWHICQGYGMTETSTVVVSTSEHDILQGTSGSLLPGCRAKVVGLDGKEITGYDQPGELLIQSPSVTLGYLNNAQATTESYIYDNDGRWMKTGDEVIVTKSPLGNEHFAVVDRLKELIKVKGHQVAPAELEAHLLAHDAVDDCAVISVHDDRDGEAPKAFVVKAPSRAGQKDEGVAAEIIKHVQDHKAKYKWLKGGVEFIDAIPKSPSGKILRRLLRDKEREARRAKGAKL
ncbi:acetyl-CoA synthetase-like protein [Coniochaeta ligniaria NRRL 30616]|uniref:Acetyl-CoA synthetase-like protein n=1 Tax=Coniochaeta ligniaria NRRL 30616 TaxID=1408157 RepID=A0A1J7JPB7_9PEZI|nr:acetyl-CoA synthetase-like protein [Coniochaeta ligniaria NRRL 30616]